MVPPHPPPPSPLAGQVAIVTGASRGIGRAIALRLAREGMHIVIAAKSTTPHPTLPGTIYTVAAEVRALGVRALPLAVDVRDEEAVAGMATRTLAAFGRIDALVCNSGALWWRDVADTPLARYDLVHGVNARGAFACTRAVLPAMRAAGHGRIIVMSPPMDGMGRWAKGKAAYLISKWGMTILALGAGAELAGTGVTVNALWPATLVESYATKNFGLGRRGDWRSADVVADAVERLIAEVPGDAGGAGGGLTTGEALIDEDYLRRRGWADADFVRYRCVPGVEPPKAWPPPEVEAWGGGDDDGRDRPPGVQRGEGKIRSRL